jgi:uncharacterized protein YbjQ (UPF0145 family)
VIISGMSGNEIYCLSLKGYRPGEIAVGNSVQSLGITGSVSSSLRSMAGGEVANITQLISQGRHAAILRMEEEAKRHGAVGITGVTSELRRLGGYTEFLSQGTAVHTEGGAPAAPPFSTSASGLEMYCHLDAGYHPVKFVMGNVAYALGLGRGLTGGLRTMAQGEVHEFSQMYNGIRHLALTRLKEEAAALGANAVVDIGVELRPFGPGIVELLLTGTAARHAKLPQGVKPEQVVTSELSGEELWNLAKVGYAPVELVMATSVFSLGVVGGLGAAFSGLSRGEIPELTRLIYHARENCLELLRKEAARLGAERVVGARLHIRELSPGLVEVIAVGTAARPTKEMEPESPNLIPQAVITETEPVNLGMGMPGVSAGFEGAQALQQGVNPAGCVVVLVAVMMMLLGMLGAMLSLKAHH